MCAHSNYVHPRAPGPAMDGSRWPSWGLASSIFTPLYKTAFVFHSLCWETRQIPFLPPHFAEFCPVSSTFPRIARTSHLTPVLTPRVSAEGL